MKKNLFFALLPAFFVAILLFSSCQKKNESTTETNYQKLLVGTWVSNNPIDSLNFTDDHFVLKFQSDGNALRASSCFVQNVKRWMEDDFQYTINGNTLVISGIDYSGKTLRIEIAIQNMTANAMKCKEIVVQYGNETLTGREFTMEKVVVDVKPELLGYWEMQRPGEGLPFYFKFNSSGSYDFYFMNEDNDWVKDENGCYFLYGRLLVTDFQDVMMGNPKRSHENWWMSINANNMIWTAKRTVGMQTYFLQKLNGLPF